MKLILGLFKLELQALGRAITPPYRWGDVIKQIQVIGWESAPVVLFCICFAAIVTIMESSFHMKIVIQNDSLVPGFAALLILRELGAILTALLITSRVGAGLAAEVGTMQITEQIDALKMLGIDPIRYLVAPRLVASIIGCAILTIIAIMTCIFAAMVVTELRLGSTMGTFLMAMRTFVHVRDLFFAAIKGAVFGAVIPIVSCYYGFRCESGAEGVGLATTNSVVTSSVSIIILDFVLSYVFSYCY